MEKSPRCHPISPAFTRRNRRAFLWGIGLQGAESAPSAMVFTAECCRSRYSPQQRFQPVAHASLSGFPEGAGLRYLFYSIFRHLSRDFLYLRANLRFIQNLVSKDRKSAAVRNTSVPALCTKNRDTIWTECEYPVEIPLLLPENMLE